MQFFESELAHQLKRRRGGAFPASGATEERYGLRVLPAAHWGENLHSLIRSEAIEYFKAPSRLTKGAIAWHKMRGHLLSSQVACLNFLMPFAARPNALAELLRPLYPGQKLQVLPILNEGPKGEERFVAFEWVGRGSYLNEGSGNSALTRGANCTSTDAVVLVNVGGRIEMLLIEWKYTEKYGSPLRNPKRVRADGVEECANDERRRRYAGKLFAPKGPLKATDKYGFDDLLWEPFYQLARQQMLAYQLQRTHEEGADRVRVLHISPSGNQSLNRVTAPRLRELFPSKTAFELWPALLEEPDCFLKRSIQELFVPFRAGDHALADWQEYIRERYAGALV